MATTTTTTTTASTTATPALSTASVKNPNPNPNPPGIDLSDIQGDVILGMPKRFEEFIFFNITNATAFKSGLAQLIPHLTSTLDVINFRTQVDEHKKQKQPGLLKFIGINIAFSFKALAKLGITDDLADADYNAGMFANAHTLGDQGTTTADNQFDPNWLPQFKTEIDGVVFIAADSTDSIKEGAAQIASFIGSSTTNILVVDGNVRPGAEKGHEHFGFKDGISTPAIPSITKPLPGQMVVQPGVILVGQTGDPNLSSRPAWAKNGSFLVYRHFNQLVPEFAKFLKENPINLPGLPPDHGSDLLGARFFGRWKSGAPIDVTPLYDDLKLANDPQRNNFFDFGMVSDQSHCPYAAHIRKTNPRSDLSLAPGTVSPHGIVRTSIPFGPEVTDSESQSGVTSQTRGLAFVCYQSDLSSGFQFLQTAWANNTAFPPKTINGTPGFESGYDPIIGQNGNNVRTLVGTNPNAQSDSLTLPVDFVQARGGEYFFSPSISALKSKFAA